MRHQLWTLAIGLGMLAAAASAHAATNQSLGRSVATCDFNGDDFLDLAAGAPGATVDGKVGAGHVDVGLGSSNGLTPIGRRTWNQGQLGEGRVSQGSVGFGSRLAAGDFNNDGFCDLAIGANGFDFDGLTNAGVVDVLYGSEGGLVATNVPGIPETSTAAQRFSENTPDLDEVANSDDLFGSNLAAADFNLDGFADLAIGTIGHDIPDQSNPFVPGVKDSGALHVLYGSAAGLQLTAPADQVITGGRFFEQDYARALAIGDFNRDGYPDLAIGAPNADIFVDGVTIASAGRVEIRHGSSTGLTGSAQHWTENSLLGSGRAAVSDLLGAALAAGDFDGDSDDDLAIGVPGEDFPVAQEAGKIIVIRGGLSGLNTVGVRGITQDTNQIADQMEASDTFGSTLASANFNGDAYDDLVIAAVNEDVGTIDAAGLINVIYGSLTGLTEAGNQAFSQDTPSVAETSEPGDRFGSALAGGDFNGDGKADLAVGVPEEDRGDTNHGGVNLLYGSSTGITVTGNLFAF